MTTTHYLITDRHEAIGVEATDTAHAAQIAAEMGIALNIVRIDAALTEEEWATMTSRQQNEATNTAHDAAIATQRSLDRNADKAWRVMMKGPAELASTIYGQEGANYLAWCKAADAAAAHRKANGWLGMTIREIAATLPTYA